MADENGADGGRPTKDADPSDSAAGGKHAGDIELPMAGEVAGLAQRDDGPDFADAAPKSSSASANPSLRMGRNGKTSRPPFMDQTSTMAAVLAQTQATFDMVSALANSPAVRMAREMAEAAQSVQRFALPYIQSPALTALGDPAFRKTLETLTITPVPRVPSLYESPQWRQLIGSIATAQQLLIAQRVAPLQAALQQHTEFLAGIIGSAANFQEVVSSFSRALHINWQQLFPNLKQLRKMVRTSLLASFLYADLWPAPSMPVKLLDKIGQLAAGDDRRPVTLAVWNHYRRDNHAALEQAIVAWEDDPEYAARRHIFAQALQGHRAKLYALTIPTLLAQVEGIAGDFIHDSPASAPAPRLGKSSQIVRHAIEVAGNAGITDPDNAEVLHVVLVEAVIEHVQQVSFESTDFAAQYADIRKRRALNRHGTLHGIQINYPSAMNSLRCFLLLDALYALRKHARQIALQAAVVAAAP